jgi:hypothetical protein
MRILAKILNILMPKMFTAQKLGLQLEMHHNCFSFGNNLEYYLPFWIKKFLI